MNKTQNFINKIFTFLVLMMSSFLYSQTDSPPSITAEGRQVFCPENDINIVTDFSIIDIDDTTIEVFFIQISSGYKVGFDLLELTGNHPNISTQWNPSEGKLTLGSSIFGTEMLLTELTSAVKDIVFRTSATDSIGERYFSLSIGDANYLPSTGHFYEFVSFQSITWITAKIAAENRTYFGRQGYLATLTSQEESDFAGKQASGPGWIGGSDEENEGVWKWVTGPEAGTVYWNGQVNGSTPNFAFWNNNEPNDFRGNNPVGEDYAHITDPSIGNPGAWNDLPNEGGTGLYIPKGYIVEYGIPSDPPLNIVASTSIYIPSITSVDNDSTCESGVLSLSATVSEGSVAWYDSETSTTPIFIGENFTTPLLTSTTTYYAAVFITGCVNFKRTVVEAIVSKVPTILSLIPTLNCADGTTTITAIIDEGTVAWYDSDTSTTPLFIGTNFTPSISTVTIFYAEAINNQCVSISRTPITVKSDLSVPEFTIDSEIILCLNIGSIELVPEDVKGNYTYDWYDENGVFITTSDTLLVTEKGEYKVKAKSLSGCESNFKNSIVIESNISTFDKNNLFINDFSNENYIEIVLEDSLGIGNYEYAIDDINGVYQSSNRFSNLLFGIHTLYIRDKNNCGVTQYEFSVLNFPKFFTPNNDGVNDYWTLKGFDFNFYANAEISIYNRFGKIITQFNIINDGWDGTYQGNELPSDSYWYAISLSDNDGKEIQRKGSFSLIRR